jgi:hypothetical protein
MDRLLYIRGVSLVMCLFSLWFITMVFMETVTFFVEMAAYVIMGIIVNAEVTVQYVFGELAIFYSSIVRCY